MAEEKVFKKGEINPHIGVTDGAMRGQLRSAARKVWRNSARRVHINDNRVPYSGPGRFKYGVICEECNRMMGQTEKSFGVKKDGTPTKNKKLAYEVDHVHDNHPFLDIEADLGKYVKTLIYGELRILCRGCHGDKTYGLSDVQRTKLDQSK